MPGGNGPRFGGRPGFANGAFSHHPGYGRSRYYRSAFAPWYYPYWDEAEPFDAYAEPAVNVASPPVVLVESGDYRPSAPPPEPPKLIEIPETNKAGATPKSSVPALFVFTNGERLEARRYTFTADSLRVETGRQQRTVPLDKLDLDATIAANRERGIDLQIPTDKNQIFLGF